MFRVEFCIIQTFLEVFKIKGSFDILQNHFVYSIAKVILIFFPDVHERFRSLQIHMATRG